MADKQKINWQYLGKDQQADLLKNLLGQLNLGEGVGDGYRIALEDMEKGQFAEAVRGFTRLMTLDPMDRRYVMGLGGAYRGLGEIKHAVTFFALACMMDGDDPMAPCECAECLLLMKDYPGAREAAEVVLELCIGKPEMREFNRRATRVLQQMN